MVVICNGCKTRLKVLDEKIAPEGSRFKCPKCSAVLLVKRPVKTEAPAQPAIKARKLNPKKIIVAHAEQAIIDRVKSSLSSKGYEVATATDGVDMMIKTLMDLPHLAIVDVALPKIYGFEVCKRLRGRAETKDMKFVLLSSVYDKKRYKREPVSLYGADDYVDEHEIEIKLLDKIIALTQPSPEEKEPAKPSPRQVQAQAEPEKPKPALATPPVTEPEAQAKPEDEMAWKARRLVRTMFADIYLYSANKVENAIKNNNFSAAFATELREGMKIYENRIPLDIRNKRNFFKEELDKFINLRKKSLGV